jgi:hypothetical protein
MSHRGVKSDCCAFGMMISQIITILEEPIAVIAYLSMAVICMAIASYWLSFRGSDETIMLRIQISRESTPSSVVPFQDTKLVHVGNARISATGMTLGASLQEAPPPFEEIAPKAQMTVPADIGTISNIGSHSEPSIRSLLVIPKPKRGARQQTTRLPEDGTTANSRRRPRKLIVRQITSQDTSPNKFRSSTTAESAD